MSCLLTFKNGRGGVMKIVSLHDRLVCSSVRIPQLYLVGGSVRDLLLGHELKDIDLVCRGAKDFAMRLAKCKNAALVPMEKKPEEPCYRIVERERAANNLDIVHLDIAEMRGETIYDDLGQRDFTINSIAIELNEDGSAGEIIDPLGGADDISRKILHLTNENSLVSDPLRILRGIRFSATLNFGIDDSVIARMRETAALLDSVSAERVFAELLLILGTPRASHFFRVMDEIDVLETIFPEISCMKGCEQNGYHHRDVWGHTMLVIENCEKILNNIPGYFGDNGRRVSDTLGRDRRLELLKMAALLHDTGKPSTAGMKKDTGRITFLRHDKEGAKITDDIAQRLKMSGRHREFLVTLVAEHLHALKFALHGEKVSARMRWFRKLKDDAVPAIILGMADVMSSMGPESTEEYREAFIEKAKSDINEYFAIIKEKIESPSFVNGDDLISLGFSPGPEFGRILEQLRNAQDTGEIKDREEGLEMARRMILKL